MRILVTGGNGQLGQEISAIVNNNTSDIDCIYKECTFSFIDIQDLDLSNLEQTKKYIIDFNPDIVINCAAYTNVDACETDKNGAFLVNAIAPRNLAIACDAINAKLVHISTDYVFSGDKNSAYHEFDLCKPNTVYGATKLLGEEYVKTFVKRFFIIRTSWLYGNYGNNFVKTIIKNAKEKGCLKVVNDQIGTPTNANDLAYHILRLALTDEYGIYHCTGNGEPCSWYEFACKIIEYANIPCNISPCTTKEFPRPAKRPSYSVLENLMLKNTIGDNMRDWKIALKSFIKELNL